MASRSISGPLVLHPMTCFFCLFSLFSVRSSELPTLTSQRLFSLTNLFHRPCESKRVPLGVFGASPPQLQTFLIQGDARYFVLQMVPGLLSGTY